MFIFCLYLSGVFFWGDFLVVFFRWIFWVIIFWVFFRVLSHEEIIILSLNIFYEWLIRGFIIFLCIIHYFYFLWEKEDFCVINFSEVIFLEIILMDVSILCRSIVENFLRRFFWIISLNYSIYIRMLNKRILLQINCYSYIIYSLDSFQCVRHLSKQISIESSLDPLATSLWIHISYHWSFVRTY